MDRNKHQHLNTNTKPGKPFDCKVKSIINLQKLILYYWKEYVESIY